MGFILDQTILYTLPVVGDVSLSNHILQFINGTGGPSQAIDYRTIQSATGAVTATAGTQQVWTCTPVAVSNTEYKLHLRQKLADGTIYVRDYSFTTPTSGTINGTLISNAFKDMITADGNWDFTMNAKGTVVGDTVPTLVLTADATEPILSATDTAVNSGGGDMGLVDTATGVAREGQGQDLIDAGVAGAVAGETYTRYEFEYLHVGNMEMSSTPAHNKLTIYADDDAAGYSDFNDEMTDIANAAIAPATEADPEAIAIA